jgi:hypothetical protein
MKVGLVFAVAIVLASGSVASAKNGALFEVCVDPLSAVVTNDFQPGSLLTASGIIVPVGTISAATSTDCSNIADDRIGTFFVRGNIVAGLPTAEPDDLAYVSWEFRVDNVGTIETTGIVKATTTPYFQPIAAATGSYHSLQDRQVRTDVLGSGGFQFRISVADK